MAQVAKIMLVEDDINLSEIYQARMAAEGYTVVSAHDGEEALALAAKEKPDLIIADVMMPKISGFEMLDILRNTEGLKSTKVIMLTALGQAEDKTRAQTLGADRYLVKSQVTLEDIVKNARELLGDENAIPPAPVPTAAPAVTPAVTAPTSAPVPQAPPAAPAPTPPPATVQPVVSANPAPTPAPTPAAPAAAAPAPIPVAQMPIAVAPVPGSAPTPAAPAPTAATATATPAGQETDTVRNQIASFEQQPAPAPVPTPAPSQSGPATVNSQILTDAVNDLLTNTPRPPEAKPGQPSATVPPSDTSVQAPVFTQHASDEAHAPIANAAVPAAASPTVISPDDSAPVAHKKIIKPMDDIGTKTDLSTLLAAEEAKDAAAATPPASNATASSDETQTISPSSPHQPGNVFSPTEAASKGTGTGIDPSSISL